MTRTKKKTPKRRTTTGAPSRSRSRQRPSAAAKARPVETLEPPAQVPVTIPVAAIAPPDIDPPLATPETAYAVSVRAVDTAGQLGASAIISVTTTFLDVTPPSGTVATIAPSNQQHADLAWLAATDDVGVTSYQVFRDGTLYATVAGGELGIRVPRTGSYSVAGVDAEGNVGPVSAPVSV